MFTKRQKKNQQQQKKSRRDPNKFGTHEKPHPSHNNSRRRTYCYLISFLGSTEQTWKMESVSVHLSPSVLISCMQKDSLGQLISPDGEKNPSIL